MRLRKFFQVLVCGVGLYLGVVLGMLFMLKLPYLQLPSKHSLHQWLGVHEHEVIGFLPYWLVNATPLSYDPYLTTLTYFGLVLNADGTIQKKVNPKELEPGWNMLGSPALKERLAKAYEHGMTLSLLVHLADEEKIAQLLQLPEQHALTLMDEIEPLMAEYDFRDLNIDIESFEAASESARQNFTTFIGTVKNELAKRNLGTLTVEMSPSVLIKPLLINPHEVGGIADRVVMMTYDYHYSGSFTTGPVAPLSGAGVSREFDVQVSIAEAERAIPKEKLILGLPLYGYEWETVLPVPEAAVIPGSGRSATNKRVAELLKACSDCIKGVDATSQESYVIYPDPKDQSYRVIFIGDTTLMKQKLSQVEKWQGAAVWALGYEDNELLEPLKDFKNQRLLIW